MPKEAKSLERVYNIPLRKEYLKVPNWKRTERAVIAVKKFLRRHMKSEQVRLGAQLNQNLWQHGIRNPPHHVKVTVIKDEKGMVRAELFGHPVGEKKEEKKPSRLEEVAEKIGLKTQEKKEEKERPLQEKTGKNPERKEQAR